MIINNLNLTLIEKGYIMIKINAPAPEFTEEAYINDQIKKISL